jgi:AAA domain
MSDLERYGLGYRRAFSGGVLMTVNRLRESRGETSCELAVTKFWEHGPPQGEPIARFRMNLSSLTARKTAARYLEERLGEVQWGGSLEILCREVLDAERGGPKLELVGAGNPPAEPDTLLGPMLPVGEPTLLYARGGTGKSTVAAGIAYSVETGVEVFPGWRPALTSPVLVIDFEGRPRTWSARLKAVAAGTSEPERAVRYIRLRSRLSDYVEEVAALVTKHAIGLVMVDGVEKAIGAGSGDGDGFKDRAQRLFEAVEQMEVTSLLVDHVTGLDARSDDDEADPYGSVYKTNWARQVWRLKRQREPEHGRAELLLKCRKYNDGELPQAVSLAALYEPGSIRFEPMAAPEAPEMVRAALSQPEQVRRILAAGARKAPELAAEMDLPANHVRVLLGRLVRRGEIARLTGDMWGLSL